MDTAAGRRLGTRLVCAPIVSALCVACGGESPPVAAECIKVVEESGQTTDECLPVAPDSERVDVGTATFSKPTPITNPLHPTSEVKQVIMGGQVDGKPFRTEVTLMPGKRPIPLRGKPVDTAISQYVAYLDGRVHEVAMDRYAQADDGSVWYFGEDVSNYEDGKVADTKGTWVAGDETPAAMIMPAKPAVGNVYRPENAPGVVFEQVRVEKIGQSVRGPSGEISGAIEVMELHMDGTKEGKVFAPGYGEYSTGSPGGDLEAVSLASPTDSRQGPLPAEFGTLSGTVAEVIDAVATANRDRAAQASTALGQAWGAALTKGIPPLMESQMNRDIDALNSALGGSDWRAAESAALRVSQNELDLRLLYQQVIDVDLARLQMWARQLPIDVAAADTGLVLADIAALERIWERTRHGVESAARADVALQELRGEADAEDLAAVNRSVTTLKDAVARLQTR
jgi:hypothetical protein